MNEDRKKEETAIDGNDTEKQIEKTNDDASSSHKPTVKPEICGWLKVFLYVLGLTCVQSVVSILIDLFSNTYQGFVALQVGDILLNVFVICLSIIAINKFVKRASNAVFYGRAFLLMCALNNVVYVFVDPEADEVWKGVAGLLWWAAWFFYLEQSSLVREVYPPESRKVQSKDWILAAACILIPWTIVLIGYLNVFPSNNATHGKYVQSQSSNEIGYAQTNSTAGGIDASTLGPGELTDGNIAFKVPSSLNTEEQNGDSLKKQKLFTISNGKKQSIFGLVVSYKCNLWNKSQFTITWNNWKDEDLEKLPSEILFDGKYSVNGNTCYEKKIRYQGNLKIILDFAALYDEKSHTLCIVRTEYIEGERNPMKEILESVRFK